jgi:glycosyltransferase involved in cell wall biosynthesis
VLNKSILFISVTFPPRLSVASLRLYHYAKLFSDHGWKVHVLTCSQKGETTSDEFNFEGLNIIHVKWKDPFDVTFKIKNPLLRKLTTKFIALFIPYLASWWPDFRFRSWRKNTIIEANKLIEKEQITHIYSSFSPPSPHMVANELKKNHQQLFWIAEFRDLMSYSHANKGIKKILANFHFGYERNILKSASEIVCVSQGHAKFLENKLGQKVNVLFNGCDFSLYEAIKPIKNSTFTITYTGNIYTKNNDTDLFFESVEKLIYSRNKKLRVLFVGTPKSTYLWSQIQNRKLENYIEFIPKMSHCEVRILQKSSDLLLHFCWSNKHQEGNLTGKIFEYISARTPILSVGEQEELREILFRTNSGRMINELEEMVSYIEGLFTNYPEIPIWSNENCEYSKLNQFKTLENRILI